MVEVEGCPERTVHRFGADLLKHLVQFIDVAVPGARVEVNELGQITYCGLSGFEEMLAFEVAFGPGAGEGGQVSGTMFGQP